MRIAVLGSGSRGNATLVEGGRTRLLVDAGFSARELERRLRLVDAPPDSLTAIWITHEHRDHAAGAGTLARRYGCPLFVTAGVRRACPGLFGGCRRVHVYRPARAVTVGDLTVEPWPTAHDAAEPVALAVTDRRTGLRAGLATDVGAPTAAVRHALRRCHALVLEANHDEVLLRTSRYPPSVKARIAGPRGHLSNTGAARLAAELHHAELALVVLAHLSEECNDPARARAAVASALRARRFRGTLLLARQDEPLGPLDVAAHVERLRGAQLALW